MSVVTTLKNSGQTVAQMLRMHQAMRLAVFDPGNPPEELPLEDHAARASLGAGAFVQIDNVIEVQADEWEAVLEGRQKLSLVGRAAYEDVFGRTHETRWLMEYEPTAQRFSFAAQFNSST